MSPAPAFPSANLNLRRRPLPGLIVHALLTPLRPFLRLLQRPAPPDTPAAVFASYMVGDLYMALPALKELASAGPVRILCRPDCVSLLAREGLDALPFDNAFLTRRTPRAFLRTAGAAWRLRRADAALRPPRTAFTPVVYDLDASPLTALWMRIAGVPRVVSYRRAYGILFHETFTLPPAAVHQADRDRAVTDHLRNSFLLPNPPRPSPPHMPLSTGEAMSAEPAFWLLSVWTRKPAKNWPLAQWDLLLQQLLDQGVRCAVLLAPDGDDAFTQFRARWEGRVGFVSGSLGRIADVVKNAAGVIATDNFLGHMAGYYGKPVVWINMVSPVDQVMPRGPRTIEVAPERIPRGEAAVTVEAVRRAFDAARAPAAALK